MNSSVMRRCSCVDLFPTKVHYQMKPDGAQVENILNPLECQEIEPDAAPLGDSIIIREHFQIEPDAVKGAPPRNKNEKATQTTPVEPAIKHRRAQTSLDCFAGFARPRPLL